MAVGRRRILEKISIETLGYPASHWEEEGVQELFCRIMGLRIKGYGKEYAPDFYLPMDTNDWIARHVLISLEHRGRLQPVCGFRFVEESVQRRLRQTFSALSIARSSKVPLHEEAILKILSRKQSIAYVGAWTIHPQFRKDNEITSLIYDMTVGLNVLMHESYGIEEGILCGSIRFKTYRMQQKIGYRPLSLDGLDLLSFRQYSLLDEPVIMLHLSSFTQEARELAEKFRPLWEVRIQRGAGEPGRIISSAA